MSLPKLRIPHSNTARTWEKMDSIQEITYGHTKHISKWINTWYTVCSEWTTTPYQELVVDLKAHRCMFGHRSVTCKVLKLFQEFHIWSDPGSGDSGKDTRMNQHMNRNLAFHIIIASLCSASPAGCQLCTGLI